MIRQALEFTAPGQLRVVDEELPPPAPGHLLVRTAVSAISAGTELLALRGDLPPEQALDDTLPALGAGEGVAWSFPFRYGYAAVGEVVAIGDGVPASWRGRRVFSFQPHASAFSVAVDDAWPIPDRIDSEPAALLANTETAVNLILDAAPRLGERVVVFGQGVVGLLTTALLARFPLQSLVVVDGIAARAQRGRGLGATGACAPGENLRTALGGGGGDDGGDGADLVFELTGNPTVLSAAVAAAGREGRVVVGSFYGRKTAPVELGGHFHRGRIAIVSSQVSRIGPALSGRWDRARRRDAAWRALGDLDAGALISHRFPLARAADAYRLLDTRPAEALQVLLTYDQPPKGATAT